MRRLMCVLLGGLLVAAMTGSAWAEIVVANSAGTVWELNNDLSTKVQSPVGWFSGTVDVSGMANGNILVASSLNGGTLWLRSPDLMTALAEGHGYGTIHNSAVVGLQSGGVYAAAKEGSTVRNADLSYRYQRDGAGNTISSVAELTDGKLVVASESAGGVLELYNGDLTSIVSDSGYGTDMRLIGLSTGNILVSDGAGGVLRVRMGSGLGGLYYRDGFLPIAAIAEFSDGKIAAVNTSGTLFVRNANLDYYAQRDNFFGTVPEMAALPNGLLAIPNTDGDLRLVDTSGATMSYRSGFGTIVSIAYVVPEPSALTLLAMGVIGLLAYVWRKRK
jgi:hypothetical protein